MASQLDVGIHMVRRVLLSFIYIYIFIYLFIYFLFLLRKSIHMHFLNSFS